LKRLLTGTAVGLLLGLTPALAQTDMPADETQTPPALEQPAMPPEAVPSETMPSDPAQPIPDLSSDQSMPDAAPAMKSTEAPKSIAPKDAAEIPSIMPRSVTTAKVEDGRFLTRQEPNDWLASNLIGKPVLNAKDESVGDINDLVTDENGKVIAVLIGVGGFLGLGEKDVAVRFESLKFARDENRNVKVMADMSSEMLTSAPDYKRLDEQALTVGDLNEDEHTTKEKTAPGAY